MSNLPLLVFDVNETLLDIDSLKPRFKKIFDDEEILREWFAQLILYSEVITLAGSYVPFGDLGAAVLRMVAAARGIQVSDEDVLAFKEAVATMPPHADVQSALLRLKSSGFRLFTLTNNPKATCVRQLRQAAIADLFEGLFSVEDVSRYKPAPEVYQMVQTSLGVPAGELMLIACHTWDIIGASAQGWRTGLILRSGNAVLSVGGQPDFVGEDLTDVSKQLIGHFSSRAP